MSIRVRFAALLHDYTGGVPVVDAEGASVGEVLDDLDRRFPGVAFRIVDEQGKVRPHMNVFVGEESARDRTVAIREGQEVYIVGALSGG